LHTTKRNKRLPSKMPHHYINHIKLLSTNHRNFINNQQVKLTAIRGRRFVIHLFLANYRYCYPPSYVCQLFKFWLSIKRRIGSEKKEWMVAATINSSYSVSTRPLPFLSELIFSFYKFKKLFTHFPAFHKK